MNELDKARQEWQAEWLAQDEINSYRNWLEKKLLEARTAELTAYLEACKAKCGHCAGTSHSLPDIVDPEPYFRPAGYVCNFGDLPDSYVHKTNWIECVPCAATEIRSLTRFAELNK